MKNWLIQLHKLSCLSKAGCFLCFAVKELKLSYSNKEALSFTIYPYYDHFIQVPSEQSSFLIGQERLRGGAGSGEDLGSGAYFCSRGRLALADDKPPINRPAADRFWIRGQGFRFWKGVSGLLWSGYRV